MAMSSELKKGITLVTIAAATVAARETWKNRQKLAAEIRSRFGDSYGELADAVVEAAEGLRRGWTGEQVPPNVVEQDLPAA